MKNIPPQHGNSEDHKSTDSEQLHSSAALADETVIHVPVLLEEVVRLLAPKKGESYLDLTAGYAGHASRVIDVIGAAHSVLVDRDEYAIAHLQPYGAQGARIIHDDFAHASESLVAAGEQFDMICVDLGVSSPQLDIARRGFSFRNDGPLDMRMDTQKSRDGAWFVSHSSERVLVETIMRYGEEPIGRAREIAHAIVRHRPINTTTELATVILDTHRGSYQKIHPATRTFQAIRIAINDELGQIEQLLPRLPQLLRPGGRVVVISFHSLEDRLVKRFFREQTEAGYEATLRSLTKKPILGSIHDVHNPRARSSILRGAVKI